MAKAFGTEIVANQLALGEQVVLKIPHQELKLTVFVNTHSKDRKYADSDLESEHDR